MKKLLVFLGLFALLLNMLAASAFAQEAASAANALIQSLPENVQGIAASVLAKVPGWVFTALTIYGTASLAYQALVAWWHKRVADTTETTDDDWTDKLESATWFKILDKIFYFGGYIGSALGGKKL
ncbi:hypothetical protein OPIT5_03765 [Opitutaceae bacterium TAV5]|nr:hypothetical protein OPIT5_03765 [Opitutaceae bacterium TAV5]